MSGFYYKERESKYEKARALRIEGYGYLYISKELDIPATTIKRWVIDIKVDPIEANRKSRFANLDKIFPKSKSGIRAKLLRDRENRCESCNLDLWKGLPITLEVEHKDGNNKNNDSKNLSLVKPSK